MIYPDILQYGSLTDPLFILFFYMEHCPLFFYFCKMENCPLFFLFHNQRRVSLFTVLQYRYAKLFLFYYSTKVSAVPYLSHFTNIKCSLILYVCFQCHLLISNLCYGIFSAFFLISNDCNIIFVGPSYLLTPVPVFFLRSF